MRRSGSSDNGYEARARCGPVRRVGPDRPEVGLVNEVGRLDLAARAVQAKHGGRKGPSPYNKRLKHGIRG